VANETARCRSVARVVTPEPTYPSLGSVGSGSVYLPIFRECFPTGRKLSSYVALSAGIVARAISARFSLASWPLPAASASDFAGAVLA
jgi:hypothetical protein